MEQNQARETRGAGGEGAAVPRRLDLLRKLADLLDPNRPLPVTERYDALPRALGLVGAAIEQLKAAEAEAERERSSHDEERARLAAEAQYYNQLFEHAPGALLLTDARGNIADANQASVVLFKRAPVHLIGCCLTAFLPRDDRPAFRAGLARLSLSGVVNEWRFVVQRVSDAALEVTAAVKWVPTTGKHGTGGMHWLLRALP
jgi:PAS domain-containing protein